MSSHRLVVINVHNSSNKRSIPSAVASDAAYIIADGFSHGRYSRWPVLPAEILPFRQERSCSLAVCWPFSSSICRSYLRGNNNAGRLSISQITIWGTDRHCSCLFPSKSLTSDTSENSWRETLSCDPGPTLYLTYQKTLL